MAMYDQIGVGNAIIDLYAETGATSNTELRIQNLSKTDRMCVYSGTTAAADKSKHFVLGPGQSEIFQDTHINVWTDGGDRCRIQVEDA